jgi:hypothetical protein
MVSANEKLVPTMSSAAMTAYKPASGARLRPSHVHSDRNATLCDMMLFGCTLPENPFQPYATLALNSSMHEFGLGSLLQSNRRVKVVERKWRRIYTDAHK